MAKEFKQFGVIDNVLSEEIYERFLRESFIAPYRSGLTSDIKNLYKNFVPKPLQWVFYVDIDDVSTEGIYVTDSSITSPNFQIIVLNKSKHIVDLNYFSYAYVVEEITSKIIKDINYVDPDVVRVRLNLALNQGPVKSHNVPHMDYTGADPHLSCTLFIGESDGDHIIFNETDKDLAAKGLPLTIGEVYEHKPNRVVYNWGNYHCGTPPIKHDFRIALNWIVLFNDTSKLHKHNKKKKLADNLDKRYETT